MPTNINICAIAHITHTATLHTARMYKTSYIFIIGLLSIWITPAYSASQPVESPQANNIHISVMSSSKQKKQRFFALMKPIIMAENSNIRQQRQRILAMQNNKSLNPDHIATLQQLAKQYRIPYQTPPNEQFWQALLSRVDIIPVELALVQAANESGWGTSRFAREGNNYFGQWCYRQDCGIVPRQRSTGATHEVRRFKHAAESVRAYMHNINTSSAYTQLRAMRRDLRERNIPRHAEVLANGLKLYSERGMAYVKTLQSMIRSNRELIAQVN
ncbi:MAG: glucosaminidase domain-containing protein [Mariprofundus sp.]|nr:glucosaminidase domain-containing protein [Mariprofundus sp.]